MTNVYVSQLHLSRVMVDTVTQPSSCTSLASGYPWTPIYYYIGVLGLPVPQRIFYKVAATVSAALAQPTSTGLSAGR